MSITGLPDRVSDFVTPKSLWTDFLDYCYSIVIAKGVQHYYNYNSSCSNNSYPVVMQIAIRGTIFSGQFGTKV